MGGLRRDAVAKAIKRSLITKNLRSFDYLVLENNANFKHSPFLLFGFGLAPCGARGLYE